MKRRIGRFLCWCGLHRPVEAIETFPAEHFSNRKHKTVRHRIRRRILICERCDTVLRRTP